MKAHWFPAYVALGANLGDPLAQVMQAFDRLAALPSTRLMVRSSCYRSRPMGPEDQPDFVNAVAGLLTRLEPQALLSELQDIERQLGRRPPSVRWGPRHIDLDLLLYAGMVSADPGLLLPHPGLAGRNFVMVPLAEIAPDLPIPGHGRAATLAHRLGTEGLELIEPHRASGNATE